MMGTSVVDTLTYALTSGRSLAGVDYLVLAVGIGFLWSCAFARRLAHRLAVSLCAFMLALVLIEGSVVVWQLARDRTFAWYVWHPNYACKLRPVGLSGVSAEGSLTTNSFGVRGPEFPPTRGYRILCVGGSTTECLYLDDTKTWPARLQDRLAASIPNLWVGNAGRSSLIAYDHLTLLKHLPEADDVDCWVVLCGINDFGQQIHGRYADSVAQSWSRTFSYRLPGLGNTLRRPLHRNLWLSAQFEDLRHRLRYALRGADAPVYQDLRADWVRQRQAKRRGGRTVDTLAPLGAFLDEYERQLTAIARLARARNKRLVFMTQPTLWSWQIDQQLDQRTLGGRFADGTYLSNAKRTEAMDRYNQVMLKVARSQQIECVDLATRMPPSPDVFYDASHFNELGAERVAELLAETVLAAHP
jgi:lysophospholipase L1-like esterase